MALTKLNGKATGIRHASETTGHIGQSGGSVHTKQLLSFRVNGKPAEIKLPSVPHIDDGESVTLVGREKAGTFRALVMRNDNTGAIYAPPNVPTYVFGALLLLVGIPLSLVVIGLPFLIVGIMNLHLAYSRTQAASMLQMG